MKSKVIMTVSIAVGFAVFVILGSTLRSTNSEDSFWFSLIIIPTVLSGTLAHWILSGKGVTSKSDVDINRIKGRLVWWYWLIGSIIFGVIAFLSVQALDLDKVAPTYTTPVGFLIFLFCVSFIAYFVGLCDSKLELTLTDKSRILLNKKGYDLLSHRTGFIVIKAEDFNSKYEDMSVYCTKGGVEDVYEWAQLAGYLTPQQNQYQGAIGQEKLKQRIDKYRKNK